MELESSGVVIDVAGSAMDAFVCAPADPAPKPGVLLLMEAFGLTSHIREVARRIAGEGYVVLAPDLYHREPGQRTFGYDEVDEGMAAMYRLDFADGGAVESDLRAALAFLERRADVAAGRIGVTGFCLGGGLAFLAAVRLSDRIAAAAGFYGMVPNAWLEAAERIDVPLLLLFGGLDPFIPLGRVAQIQSLLARLGKDARIEVYREADHGFFCDESESYDRAAAEEAWRELTGFFRNHLKRA